MQSFQDATLSNLTDGYGSHASVRPHIMLSMTFATLISWACRARHSRVSKLRPPLDNLAREVGEDRGPTLHAPATRPQLSLGISATLS